MIQESYNLPLIIRTEDYYYSEDIISIKIGFRLDHNYKNVFDNYRHLQ